MKKVLSFVLALCMICTLLPATALTAIAADTEVVFELGANKNTTTHADGSSAATYSETVGGYTLSITGGTKMYKDANDAKGNSCIKLGSSGGAGGFSFTVPDDVTSVVIAIAKYKSNTTKISINSGATQTLTKNSNDGAYDEITVDTSSTKTVSLTTVSGGYRAMVNSITFVVEGGSTEGTTAPDVPTCEHTNTVAIGEAKDATCTEAGITAGEKCADCGEEITAQKEIPALGHNYVDGVCSRCNEEQPNEATGTISFATADHRISFSTSQQVWSNEGVTLTNNKASSTNNVVNNTNPVRLYANSELVFEAPGNITEIVVECNTTSYATALNNSAKTNATVTVDSKVVTIKPTEMSDTYTIAKLTAQTRFNSLTITYEAAASEPDCEHTNTVAIGEAKDPTCTEAGITAGEKCADCGEVITAQETIPATGHSFANGVCVCGAEKNALVTNVEDLQIGDRIVIVAKDSNYAMSTEQKTSNRGQAAVTKDANGAVGTEAQVLTLKAGMVDGTIALYTGEGYLYAASSSSNQLKTDDVKTANGSWKIEIAADGTATIVAQGDNERNWMRYNSSSGLFACYASGQQDVAIYKLTNSAAPDAVEHIYTSGSETVAKDYANINDALTATKGTLKLLADVTADEVSLNDTVTLDLNGKTLTAGAIAGTVMDNADGEGLVKVAQGSAVLSSVDGQMLLWDNTNNASGYRAFNYTLSNLGMDANENEDKKDAAVSEQYNTTVKSFWSDINFTNAKAYTLVASKASGLKVSFKLALDDGSSGTFEFSDETVGDWALAEESNDGTQNFCFYISVYGFDALGEGYELTVTPVINFAGTNTVEANATVYSEA